MQRRNRKNYGRPQDEDPEAFIARSREMADTLGTHGQLRASDARKQYGQIPRSLRESMDALKEEIRDAHHAAALFRLDSAIQKWQGMFMECNRRSGGAVAWLADSGASLFYELARWPREDTLAPEVESNMQSLIEVLTYTSGFSSAGPFLVAKAEGIPFTVVTKTPDLAVMRKPTG